MVRNVALGFDLDELKDTHSQKIFVYIGIKGCAICCGFIQMLCISLGLFVQTIPAAAMHAGAWQLKQEWSNNTLIKDVFVVDGATTCASKDADSSELFYYNWAGLRTLFLTKGNIITYAESSRGANNKNNVMNPVYMPSFPLLKAYKFNGKRVCGKKLKLSYEDVVQPDSSGNCPHDFALCPGISRQEN